MGLFPSKAKVWAIDGPIPIEGASKDCIKGGPQVGPIIEDRTLPSMAGPAD